ncbi:MAG: hypothetical protein ACODAJ_01970 [Planctomycetota bacterium]
MRHGRWLVAVAAAAAVVTQAGCTFFGASGGGPLRRSELGDWAGMSEMTRPAGLQSLVAELKETPNSPFTAKYSLRGDAALFSTNFNEILDVPFTPAPGLRIKGRLNPWLRFVPGPQSGDWLYYDESDPSARQFYAAEHEWDALVAWGERVDAWDVATGERVAARGTFSLPGFGLGYNRVRKVRPVDAAGLPGLDTIAYTKRPLSDVRYDLRDGSILFLGLLGWGRVNRIRYLQVLWIPIAIGTTGP